MYNLYFFYHLFQRFITMYVVLFFSLVLIFGIVDVNEEFYISLGLFIFFFMIFFFISEQIVMVYIDNLIDEEFSYSIGNLTLYHTFLKELFNFFAVELVFWALLYKVQVKLHAYRILKLQEFLKKHCNSSLFKMFKVNYFIKRTIFYFCKFLNGVYQISKLNFLKYILPRKKRRRRAYLTKLSKNLYFIVNKLN